MWVEKLVWEKLATIYPQVSHICKVINETASTTHNIRLVKRDQPQQNLAFCAENNAVVSAENQVEITQMKD